MYSLFGHILTYASVLSIYMNLKYRVALIVLESKPALFGGNSEPGGFSVMCVMRVPLETVGLEMFSTAPEAP